MSELAQKAGVTKRTIHYYISKGLLMPPNGTGVNSLYDDTHYERIMLIKKFQSEYLPLNKIRECILENKTPSKVSPEISEISLPEQNSDKEIYIKENVLNIFEMHYTPENAQKYQHIIENVKNYVKKMLED